LTLTIYFGDGNGYFQAHRIFSTDNIIILLAVVDFNHDNYQDIFARSPDGVIKFLNTAGQFDNSSQIFQTTTSI